MDTALKNLLDEIKKISGVKKVSVVSRTGMNVGGDTYENQDTFAAMTAIILGAAETASSSIGNVKKVVITIEPNNILLLLPAGRRGILAILAEEDISEKIRNLINKFKEII